MSLPSISQTVTSDSLVCIPSRVAKQIVIDLEHYDLVKVENDTLKSNIVDYQTIVEKQNDIAVNETLTAGYQMLNAKLSRTFDLGSQGELTLSLFGNNMLDEIARNHSSFVKNEVPLPGRNYGLRFNLNF